MQRADQFLGQGQTLVDLLRLRATGQPDQVAYTYLLDGDTEEAHLTYGELDTQARRIAAELQRLAKPGDRALLLFPPGLAFAAAFFGCLYAGVIAVPVYPPHPAKLSQDLTKLVALSGRAKPTIVLTVGFIAGLAEDLFAEAPSLQALHWVVVDDLTTGEDSWLAPDITAETLAFLQFTSGSTAAPKGVILTHGNLLHNEAMIRASFQHSAETIVVGWLPLYHDMGLIGNMLQPMYLGVPCILMSPIDFLQKPFRWLQAISRYKATTSGAPNFAYDLCIRKVKPEQLATLDLSTWTLAYNGAEPLRAETMRRFAEAFGPSGFKPEAFFPCYGLAEATLIVTGDDKASWPQTRWVSASALERHQVIAAEPDSAEARELMSSGHAWLGQQVVIVDPDTSRRCGDATVGEIWVQGPSVAQGYWEQPEESERAFQAKLADTGDDPFLRTGDLGFFDGDQLYVTGRLKDLIILQGRNHYPQDIERTIEQAVPGLRPGCVAAFAVEIDGQERVVVVAEVDPAMADSITDLPGTVRQVVTAGHDLRVHETVLVESRSIPKTSSGKIQRHACRTAFLAGSLDRITP
ncbi:MAG: fatty acyl-AMP ligase [Candidatus Sericytochromatia bacterium]|nr:fatty acyl-AMP ligase [Candidatus Sericytochromatia bacterium]